MHPPPTATTTTRVVTTNQEAVTVRIDQPTSGRLIIHQVPSFVLLYKWVFKPRFASVVLDAVPGPQRATPDCVLVSLNFCKQHTRRGKGLLNCAMYQLRKPFKGHKHRLGSCWENQNNILPAEGSLFCPPDKSKIFLPGWLSYLNIRMLAPFLTIPVL